MLTCPKCKQTEQIGVAILDWSSALKASLDGEDTEQPEWHCLKCGYESETESEWKMPNETYIDENGLVRMLPVSLRDQFAMAALTGLLIDKYQCDGTIRGYAERCYAFADAMLAEREKKK